MTGFGSVVNPAPVVRGSSVVVIGCGAVGLNAIQAVASLSPTVVVKAGPDGGWSVTPRGDFVRTAGLRIEDRPPQFIPAAGP
jgi:hypothetical protein